MAGAADVHTQQDLCMKKRTGTAKAGITIYMTLTLLVMVSLITGAIKAAKVQAGRAAAAGTATCGTVARDVCNAPQQRSL